MASRDIGENFANVESALQKLKLSTTIGYNNLKKKK
jgi:hypothetical protein